MISTILIGMTILFVVANLYYFFTNKTHKKSGFDSALFYKLFFVLVAVTFGFALLYYLLSFNEVILVINDPTDAIADTGFFELSVLQRGDNIVSRVWGSCACGLSAFFRINPGKYWRASAFRLFCESTGK